MMKSKLNRKVFGIAFASLLLVGGIAFGEKDFSFTGEVVRKAEAASDLDSYYSKVNGKGSVLLSSVRTAITADYNNLGYDGLWTAYQKTDKRSDGYVRDLYSDHTMFPFNSKKCGNYSSIGDCWNREHTIPQSWWGKGTSNQGCDIYIVWPSDGKINGMRSNYAFGIVDVGTSYKLSGDPEGNELGDSAHTEYVTGKVFEPFDDRKGDMARTYFYAVARWSAAPTWTSGDGSKVFSSSGNNGFVQKYLNMLLKWHHDDPVSEFEIARNDGGQATQGNRNPFVDHPSYVDLIWGGEYPSTGLNYENTNNGTASVVNGKIGGGSTPSTVSVTGVSLNKTSLTLTKGETETLTATVLPTNATNKNVTWSTTNSSVATVSNGLVTAVSAGSATIKVTTQDGSKVASCSVTVNNPVRTLSSISVYQAPDKLTYVAGESFDATGLEITRYYSDGWSDTYTYDKHESEFTFTPTTLTTNVSSVTITYSGKTTTQYVSVQVPEKTLAALTVEGDYKTTFTVGDTFSFGNGAVIATFSDGSQEDVTDSALFSDYDMSLVGTQLVTVEYMYNDVIRHYYYEITVSAKESVDPEIPEEITGYTLITDQVDLENNDQVVLKNEPAEVGDPIYGVSGFDSSHDSAYTSTTESDWIKYTVEKTDDSSFKLKDGTAYISEPDATKNKFDYTTKSGYGTAGSFVVTSGGLLKPEANERALVRNGDYCRFYGYSNLHLGPSMKVFKVTSATPTEEKVLASISLSNMTTVFIQGGSFAFDGKCEAIYSNGTKAEVTPTSVSSPDMTEVGKQIVTVTYVEDGVTKTAEYSIVVKKPQLTGIIVYGMQTEFLEGEEFVFNGSVVAQYENDLDEEVEPTSISKPDMSKVGTQEITVTYIEDGVTATKTYNITINKAKLTGISISKMTTNYTVGDTFSFDGVVTAAYENGRSKTVTPTSISSPDMSKAGSQAVTVTYKEDLLTFDAKYTITVSEAPVVRVSGVSLDKESATLEVGATETLVPTVAPTNATNKNVSWSTSDANIAIVRDGVVTAVSAGRAIITVTTVDGNKSATCFVTVNDAQAEVISVTGVSLNKQSTSIEVGTTETLTATIAPSNATNKNVSWTSSNEGVATVKGGVVTGVSAGTTTIIVTTVDGGKTAACNVTVTASPIAAPTLSNISVTTLPSKTAFILGETFTSEGLVVTATYSDGTTKVVEATITAPDMSTTGTKTVTLTYTEEDKTVSTSYTITVSKSPLKSISLSGMTTEYTKGDTFSFDGVVTATYENNTTEVVRPTSVSTPNMNVVSNNVAVTITYTENGVTQTATYYINVKVQEEPEKTLEEVKQEAIAELEEYYAGFDLSKYSQAGKDALRSALNNGKANINKATTKDQVTSALIGAKAVMDGVQVGQETASKYGCVGNISTTSIVLSLLALTGIALLLIKKRKTKFLDK